MHENELTPPKEESKALIARVLQMMIKELGDDAREEATIYLPDQIDMSILFHDYSIMFTKKYNKSAVEIDFCRMSADGKPDFFSIGATLGPHTIKIAKSLRKVIAYLQDQGLTIEGKARGKRFGAYSRLAETLGIKSVALKETP